MNEGMNDDIIQHWNRESCQVGQSVGKLLQEHRCMTLMKYMKGKKKKGGKLTGNRKFPYEFGD